MAQAIHNVKHHYLIVGLLDNFSEFLHALEILIPEFFRGISEMYASAGRVIYNLIFLYYFIAILLYCYIVQTCWPYAGIVIYYACCMIDNDTATELYRF